MTSEATPDRTVHTCALSAVTYDSYFWLNFVFHFVIDFHFQQFINKILNNINIQRRLTQIHCKQVSRELFKQKQNLCYLLIKLIVFFISKAIGNPLNEELQIKAWDVVLPLVNRLKHFYEFSLKLGSNYTFIYSTNVRTHSTIIQMASSWYPINF